MLSIDEQAVIDFSLFPPVGEDDWRYTFSTAKVRVLESAMLTRGVLLDMANAPSFEAAVDQLSGSEYALGQQGQGFDEIEAMLLERRTELRHLFAGLIDEADTDLIELLKARTDFANMRLAVRRVVTERPIGADYSDEGSVPADEFEEIFEQENYDRFPLYLRETVEAAVLGYYEKKDIRQIDYAIDKYQAGYKLKKARELNSVFLTSFFRVQVDLNNVRTMLRLKMAGREDEKDRFLPGGYIEVDRLVHGLAVGYEAVAGLFYATPYYEFVESGVSYLVAEKSFLGLEKRYEEYMGGFLKTTGSIAAGPQPVIAYLLMKENEIRTVRMLLTAKKNNLQTKYILDRLAEF